MIRKYSFLLFLICSIFLLGSCKDDSPEVKEEVVPGVQNLKAISQVDGVLLSWENMENRAYDKVEISYVIQGENKVLKEEIKEKFSTVHVQLPDAEVYKFTVRCIPFVSGQSIEEDSVKGRKLVASEASDELTELLNSVEISGGDNGVRIFWENPQDIQALIRLEYAGQTHDIKASSLSKEYSLRGLELNKPYVFTVSVVYESEVSQSVRMLTATALEKAYRKMENNGWTITASSQQAAQPATNLLDNKPQTYWRSSALMSAGAQQVIVDLKSLSLISALTFTRRLGDGENSSWDINISLSEDGTNYTTPYQYKSASTDPNPIFKVEFNRTVDGEQMYQLPYTHQARYVKINFVRAANGAYAVYGDINFYGE